MDKDLKPKFISLCVWASKNPRERKPASLDDFLTLNQISRKEYTMITTHPSYTETVYQLTRARITQDKLPAIMWGAAENAEHRPSQKNIEAIMTILSHNTKDLIKGIQKQEEDLTSHSEDELIGILSELEQAPDHIRSLASGDSATTPS